VKEITMGWTANATVQDVSGTVRDVGGDEGPPVTIVLAADGDAITVDGDDQVTSVEITVTSPVTTHLAVGDVVQVVANC
jgi:hypothetical protein